MMNPLYSQALIGGVLIGIAALIFSGGLGRVMGVSGILKGILPKSEDDSLWRYAYFLGLIGGVGLYRVLRPEAMITFAPVNTSTLILAGILVGIGVSMANGCTSGHAICGIGRLSYRSIMATSIFLTAGIITVYITHHIL